MHTAFKCWKMYFFRKSYLGSVSNWYMQHTHCNIREENKRKIHSWKKHTLILCETIDTIVFLPTVKISKTWSYQNVLILLDRWQLYRSLLLSKINWDHKNNCYRKEIFVWWSLRHVWLRLQFLHVFLTNL